MPTPPVSFFTSYFLPLASSASMVLCVSLYTDPGLLYFLPLSTEGKVRQAWLWSLLLSHCMLEKVPESEPGGLILVLVPSLFTQGRLELHFSDYN